MALGESLLLMLIPRSFQMLHICILSHSKRWHKGQGHTKVEMGTLGAASGYSFMKPSAAAAAHANFQMGVEERLRWAQIAEAISHQNPYAVSSRLPNFVGARNRKRFGTLDGITG